MSGNIASTLVLQIQEHYVSILLCRPCLAMLWSAVKLGLPPVPSVVYNSHIPIRNDLTCSSSPDSKLKNPQSSIAFPL